jgi:hypothetical protein
VKRIEGCDTDLHAHAQCLSRWKTYYANRL